MNISGNTILVTGGASGIGKALAIRFLERGNEVVVCGRREDILDRLRSEHPQIPTIRCDVASRQERETLVGQAADKFPGLNVLVNNAGVQRRVDLNRTENWDDTRSEIAINLEAPIHLSELFQERFESKPQAAIINVTSGLSFVPLANVPIY